MIVKQAVNRPITVLVAFALILGIGFYTMSDLTIDLYPDIDMPIILVTTTYAGNGPKDVEQNVTRVLEGSLVSVSGIKKMTSTSYDATSSIKLEFEWGTNLESATNDVRDKLDMVKDKLPDDCDSPQIFKFDPDSMPIMKLALKGDNRSADELRQIAEDSIEDQLEQVSGVATATSQGGRERAVRVDVSQNRIEAYGITLTGIASALASQNLQVGGGKITEGKKNFQVRTAGDFSSVKDISEAVVGYRNSEPVLLKEVATVTDGFKDEDVSVLIDGEEGVYVSIKKQSGTNSVKIADKVYAKIKEINKTLPKGVELIVLDDDTESIRDAISSLVSSAYEGIILCVLVIFVFLRSFRPTLVIAISIPISVLVTIMCMNFAGLTLNMMTLSGLILGVGMIVDSSIVVLDNIVQYRLRGAKPLPAAVLGSQEMISAITSSTLTTVSVFIPLILFKYKLDMIGVIFQDMIFTIIIALLASLVVAVTLVPVLASTYLPIMTRAQKPLKNPLLKRLDDGLEAFFDGMYGLYRKVLTVAIDNRGVTIALVVSLLAVSVLAFTRIPMSLMPDTAGSSVTMNVELPVGSRLEDTKSLLSEFEKIVKSEVKGYDNVFTTAGSSGRGIKTAKDHVGELTVTLPAFEERIDDAESVKKKLRAHFQDFPAVTFSINRHGPNSSSYPIDVAVKCDNMDKLFAEAEKIKNLVLDKVPAIAEMSMDVTEGLPELDVVLDRKRAYSFGLTTKAVGREVSAAVYGTTASVFRKDGKEYDIIVQLQKSDRSSVVDLNRIFLVNDSGRNIPISSFAKMEKTLGPVDIKRENQTRTIHLQAELVKGANARDTENEIKKVVARDLVLDEGVLIEYTGDWGDVMEYGLVLVVLMTMAIALVFGVMASQYESLKDPFINLFTIPLMLVGVAASYYLSGSTFSMFSTVGLIMLAGIVVNNGIVLVDYTNLLRGRGAGLREACIEAGASRLRPVLITSITTIIGTVPMAFSPGESSDFIQPIAITLIGGLASSTFITLFLIPVLYYVFNGSEKTKEAIHAEA